MPRMAITIVQLNAFQGPNLYGPRPGVLLRIAAKRDLTARLRSAVKDAAQSVGMVIAGLSAWHDSTADGVVSSVHFSTPTPSLGVKVAQYVVDGLNAQAANDEDWDAEGPLWELQRQRRAEALPLPALQITAEAVSRGIPWFQHANGHVQLGMGARSWQFDPAVFAKKPNLVAADSIGVGRATPPTPTLDVPWERLGPIPIVAIAGDRSRDLAALLIATTVRTQAQTVECISPADLEATHRTLAAPTATFAVLGLDSADSAARGIGFERCAYSAITDLPDALPSGIADRDELARVLGVAMLVTDPQGVVALNVDIPEIAALAEFAPCPYIAISTQPEQSAISVHRANGGAALFVQDGVVIAAQGMREQPLLTIDIPPEQQISLLAAFALLWAMGISWDTMIASVIA